MNDAKLVENYFQCDLCQIETDRGYRVRVNQKVEYLCRGCYQKLIESRGARREIEVGDEA